VSRASQTAYRVIRANIISGVLASGAHLKEEELTRLCGVSRTPVREAMRTLEAEGFIAKAENGRMFVPRHNARDVEDHFSLRALMEGEIASLAALRAESGHIARMRAASDAIGVAIETGDTPDIENFIKQNRIFHTMIADAAASPTLRDTLIRLVKHPIVVHTPFSYHRADLLRSHEEHTEIIAAVESRNATSARTVMCAHIQRAYKIYVQTISG
jgi:DNA-binding GntR family transcriptional regulator